MENSMYLSNVPPNAILLESDSKFLTGKKVAMLVSNSCVGDARVIKMAEAVRDMGAEVKVFGIYRNSDQVAPYEVIGNIHYQRNHWLPMDKIKKRTKKIPKKISPFIAPKINKFAFGFSKYEEFKKLLYRDVVSFSPDIIHAHDLITLPLGEAASSKTGAKLIYDAHEYEIYRNPPLPLYMKKYVKKIEGRGVASADHFITCGDLTGGELKELYNIQKMDILYNAPRISPLKGYDIKQQLRLDESTPLVVYVGKVTEGRGIEEVMPVIARLTNVHYACVGPCDERAKKEMLKFAAKNGIEDRFHLVPPVHFDNVVSFIQTADLGIVSVMPVTRSYYYAMPNKLFELGFARVPILINDLAEAAPIVRKYELGEVYDSENPGNLAYYITYMLKHKNIYAKNDELFKDFWRKYSWETQVKKLNSIYESLISTK